MLTSKRNKLFYAIFFNIFKLFCLKSLVKSISALHWTDFRPLTEAHSSSAKHSDAQFGEVYNHNKTQ